MTLHEQKKRAHRTYTGSTDYRKQMRQMEKSHKFTRLKKDSREKMNMDQRKGQCAIHKKRLSTNNVWAKLVDLRSLGVENVF